MRPTPHKSYTRQQGLSLIEVMIALLIGIILLSGAVSIFISNNAAANLGAQLSRMQDNGRLLIDVLSRDIRMAGYSGCTSRGNVPSNVIAKSPPLLPFADNSSVRGYNADSGGTWDPQRPPELITVFDSVSMQLNIKVRDGTDILVVQHADECVGHVVQQTSASPLTVYFPRACNFPSNSTDPLPLIISDCNTTDVFQSASITLAPGDQREIAYGSGQNSSANLSTSYDTDAIVSVPLFSIFYIGENNASLDPNDPELSLYMLRWEPDGDTAHEGIKVGTNGDYRSYKLADGVQDMQLEYGVDTSDTNYPDTYMLANDPMMNDPTMDYWSNIRSVRINLLLRSADNTVGASDPKIDPFPGLFPSANPDGDRRLRFAFSATVSLRNRLP